MSLNKYPQKPSPDSDWLRLQVGSVMSRTTGIPEWDLPPCRCGRNLGVVYLFRTGSRFDADTALHEPEPEHTGNL